MQLIQLKIRGLGNVPETDWMVIKSPVTIFRFDDQSVARSLMLAMQTLNPPFDCRKIDPFQEYPTKSVNRDGHQKVIQPSRRTISFAIFNSSPSLVTELGSISELFYETDRIEVGRRLNYSRWISFVELAASSRWSEIEADIKQLQKIVPASAPFQEPIRNLIIGMNCSDRIKGETATLLDEWLSDIRTHHVDKKVIASVIEKVRRSSNFKEAQRIVKTRIPLFLVSGMNDLRNTLEKSQRNNSIEPIRFPPVMLVDLLDNSNEEIIQLLNSLHESTAEKNQYLCFISKRCPLPDRYKLLSVSG